MQPYKYQGNTAATTGAISELRIAIDLMSKGYHIFRTQSPNCPCDLVAIKDNKTFTIEVRTIYRNQNGSIPPSAFLERQANFVNCFALVFKNYSDDITYYDKYHNELRMD